MNCCYQANFHSDNRRILGSTHIPVRKRKRKKKQNREGTQRRCVNSTGWLLGFCSEGIHSPNDTNRYSSRLVNCPDETSGWESTEQLEIQAVSEKRKPLVKNPKSMLPFLEAYPCTHGIRLRETGENNWTERLEIFPASLHQRRARIWLSPN